MPDQVGVLDVGEDAEVTVIERFASPDGVSVFVGPSLQLHAGQAARVKYLEQIGTYNPLLAKDDPIRVKLDEDRARYWLGVGAQPSDRVLRFLDAANDTDIKVGLHSAPATEGPSSLIAVDGAGRWAAGRSP